MTRPESRYPPSNVLVLAPDWRSGIPACADAVSDGVVLLVVSYSRPAESYLSFIRDHAAGEPAETVVIEASRTRGTTRAADVDIRARGPTQLSVIGTEVTDLLEGWHEGGAEPVVYFDSITALLQYEDIDRVYRFLHPFASQIELVGARAFYRLAPAAHDRSTVATVEQLFGGVVRFDPESTGGLERP